MAIDPMDEKRRQQQAQIDDISAALEGISKKDVTRLPERNFVEVCLPFFAGDTKPKYPIDMNTWLNIAGGPYCSVDVIDNKGQVLFTIPPIFDRSAIDPTAKGRHSMAHIVATTNLYVKQHPKLGANYLDKELTGRALVMKVPAAVQKHLEIWNSIFTRYKRPPMLEVQTSDKEIETTSTKLSASELNFQLL